MSSGTLAFDGRALYYADYDVSGQEPAVVHRLSAATNARLPDLSIPGLRGLYGLSYDPMRHVLYAVATDPDQTCGDYSSGCPPRAMYEVSLPGLSVRKMFALPNDRSTDPMHYSYDFTIERFRVLTEGLTGLETVDRSGNGNGVCSIEGLGGGEPLTLAAVGSREAYVQLADGRGLHKVNAACRVVAQGEHPYFEKASTNAAMVCDTVTFKKPAVWLRNGNENSVSAYEVPGGYCPLPTRLSPVSAGDTTVGGTTQLCAELSTPGLTLRIPDEQVRFLVDGRQVGAAVTDSRGRACYTYAPREPGTKWITARAGGTPAYLASASEGVINVVPGRGSPPRQGTVVRPEGPRGNEPPTQPAAKPNPAPGTQPQAQPQPQPGGNPVQQPVTEPGVAREAQVQAQLMTQPQAQAQGAFVPQLQGQPQLADRLAMSRYAALPLGLATVAMGSVGWVLARREVSPARI